MIINPRNGLLAASLLLATAQAHPGDTGQPLSRAQAASIDQTWTEAQLAAIQSLGPWPPRAAGNEVTLQARLNPLSGQSEAIVLGETLFHDPALSGTGKRSCASCHQASKAFTDGQPSASGLRKGRRNTPALFDLADQRWFGWDGGSDSLWAATLRPLLDAGEMASSAAQVSKALSRNARYRSLLGPLYKQQSQQGGVWQTATRDEKLLVLAAMSIAAWMEGLTSARTPFDRYRDALILADATQRTQAIRQSGFTEAAKQGLATFIGKGNCIVCHGGPRFTHGEFHDIGIPFLTTPGKSPANRDAGAEVDPGRYRGIERVRTDRYNLNGVWSPVRDRPEATLIRQTVLQHRNWGEWKIPGLRNLKLTAPYMHNGSLASLRDVVRHYSQLNEERLHADGEALLKPLRPSVQEEEDLVAFLESLSPP